VSARRAARARFLPLHHWPPPPPADDLGYNEVGFQNASRGLQTPNLDALVR